MVKMVIYPCQQSNIMVKQHKIGWCKNEPFHEMWKKNYAFSLHEDSSINLKLKLKYINKFNVELCLG